MGGTLGMPWPGGVISTPFCGFLTRSTLVILLVWLPTHYNGHLSYKNFYLNANTVTLDIFKLINWGILHMKQYR